METCHHCEFAASGHDAVAYMVVAVRKPPPMATLPVGHTTVPVTMLPGADVDRRGRGDAFDTGETGRPDRTWRACRTGGAGRALRPHWARGSYRAIGAFAGGGEEEGEKGERGKEGRDATSDHDLEGRRSGLSDAICATALQTTARSRQQVQGRTGEGAADGAILRAGDAAPPRRESRR